MILTKFRRLLKQRHFRGLFHRRLLALGIIVMAIYLAVTIAGTFFATKQLADHYLSIYIVSDNIGRITAVQREISSLLELIENIENKLADSVRLTPTSISRNGFTATELMYNFRQLHPAIGKIFYTFTSEEDSGETIVLTNFGYISDSMFNNRYGSLVSFESLITAQNEPFLFNSLWYDTPLREEILYVFPEQTDSQSDRIFIFQLNVDYFRSIMDTEQTALQEHIFLFDAQGQLLLSLHPEAYEQDINIDALLEGIDAENSMLEYGGGKYYAAEVVAPDGMRFVRLIAMDQFVTQALYANTIIILLLSMLLLVGLMFLGFFINYFHKPISRLVRSIQNISPPHVSPATVPRDELDFIRNTLQQSFTQNQNLRSQIEFARPSLIAMFINNLIRARYTSYEEFGNSCKNLGVELDGPLYTVVCIEVLNDRYRDNPDALFDLFNTQLPDELHGYIGVFPGARIHNLLLSSAAHSDKKLYVLLQEYKSALFRNGNLAVAISLGETVTGIQQVGHSYISAYSALQYRFVQGSDGVLTWQDAEDWESQSIPYPSREMQQFIAGVTAWNAKEIVVRLDNIRSYIYEKKVPLRMARFICYDIIAAFSNAVSIVNRASATDLYRRFDLLSLMEFTSVRQLCSTIALMSEQIEEFISTNVMQGTPHDSDLIINYIRMNIGNPNFTIESIATYFHIPYKRLRTLFKESTGQTLLECYQFLRMEEVKRLLVETSQDIETIANHVGYTSASSLIRSFRQEIGMSPGKYREQKHTARN